MKTCNLLVSLVLSATPVLLTSCASSPDQINNYADSDSYHGSRRAFDEKIAPPGKRLFIFNPKDLAWGAYSADGTLVGYGKASGGSNWCVETQRECHTPAGIYHIISKGGADCVSTKYPLPYGGAHMPYCTHFRSDLAIHGAPPRYVPNYNASHGCIRVTTNAARWLQDRFLEIGTTVKVTSY